MAETRGHRSRKWKSHTCGCCSENKAVLTGPRIPLEDPAGKVKAPTAAKGVPGNRSLSDEVNSAKPLKSLVEILPENVNAVEGKEEWQ